MNEPTAEQIVEQVQKQLLQALIAKDDAQAKLKEAELQVTAIRNVLAGLSVGLKSAPKAPDPAPAPQAE